MNSQRIWSIVMGITVLLLAAGLAGAVFSQPEPTVAQEPIPTPEAGLVLQTAVTDVIAYQGRLTDPAGAPVNGTYTMRFVLYDDLVAGTAVWDSGNLTVEVAEGLFKVDLDVNQADMNGQALWLSIIIEGETLSPRQALYPAPYALSLKPGASVSGEPLTASGAVLATNLEGDWPAGKALAGYAPSTGTAVYAQASGGQGVYAYSDDTYGVWGSSDVSWGGYFASNQGYGIRVSTGGADHWDHGAYIEANSGYGVYATSSQNMAIRGEAGNIDGLWQPVGKVGVVGIGESRGVYGSSDSSYGIYGTSLNWYGIYGRTSRTDNNYGLYTPDNFYSLNINMAGAMMQVAQNGGSQSLEPGDVAVFSGISRLAEVGDSPVIQVANTNSANSQAVAGVVYSRFNGALLNDETGELPPDTEVTPAGPVAPGEYLLLVVHGPAQVKVSDLAGAVQPGDLLATAGEAGLAAKAQQVTLQGVTMAVPGTILGKALEPVTKGQDKIYVFVTLQ